MSKKIISLLILFILVFSFFIPSVSSDTATDSFEYVESRKIGLGRKTWNNPTNALTDDNQYTYSRFNALGNKSQGLVFNNLSTSIPSDATIDGIQVNVTRQASDTVSITDESVYLVDTTNSTTGENKAVTGASWTTSVATQTYGGSSDLWGWTDITPSDVNHPDFGFFFTCEAPSGGTVDARVYYVEMTIYYTPPNDPPETRIAEIPDNATYDDVVPIEGDATDEDGTINMVEMQIKNDTDSTWWYPPDSKWIEKTVWFNTYPTDGSFDSSYERYYYNITYDGGSFTYGKDYTVYARAQDDDSEYDPSPASDTFRYIADVTSPDITINFAGNLGDEGGPYWRPPDETTQLSGVWKNGYYTNASHQTETWMYINITVTDNSSIDNVYFNVYTASSWTRWTYTFLHTGGEFYEFNTSGNFSLSGETSFNIVANDTYNNSKKIWWNKTGIGGTYTRRYVNFGTRISNISYEPFYFYENNNYGSVDQNKEDRLKYDQGAEGTLTDTGKLHNTLPDDTIQLVWCDSFFGFWFNDGVAINPTTIENIYYHFWWSSDTDEMTEVGYNVSREDLTYPKAGQYYSTNSTNSRSTIYYDNQDTPSNNYYLETNKFNNPDLYFTDNNIYEFAISMLETPETPSSICNRSLISFVIFNLPSDDALRTMHSDNDGLTDYDELYTTYTSPFLEDTDNDGYDDLSEYENNTDPNNYTDYPEEEIIWIDVTPDQWNLGTVQMDSRYYTNGTGNTFTAVKDNCTVYTDLSLQITNDASDWSAATSGNGPGVDIYRLNASIDTWSTENQILTSSNTIISSNIAPSANETFDHRFDTPTSTTSGDQQTITVTATLSKH